MVTIIVCYNTFSTDENYNRLIKTPYRYLNLDTVVIVNTKLLYADILDKSGSVISSKEIPKANDEMEFSGYYEGIKFAFSRLGEVKEALFLNDTIYSHGRLRKCESLALFEYAVRGYIFKNDDTENKTIKGFLHKSSYLNDVPNFHEYINSKFFIVSNLNLNEYDKLFNIGRIDVRLSVVNGYENSIYPSDSYAYFLSSWLNGGGWYKSRNLVEDNIAFFRSKAKSIIHEHYMSDPSNELFDSIECLMKNSSMISLISKFTGFSY